MRELSLHILDIAQNSISAGATLIKILVNEDILKDKITIQVSDNGCGMNAEQLKHVNDPFYTTRTTRKVGMGIPLFRMAAELAGGSLNIQSEPGVGTTVTAYFVHSHIDRIPMGDIGNTMITLIRLNQELNFIYTYTLNGSSFILDTREIRKILEDVPLNSPEVILWIEEYMREQIKNLPVSPENGEPKNNRRSAE